MSPEDQERITQTYRSEREKMLGYIRKRAPQGYEAEDILQDVFYQLSRGFNGIERIENLTAWIYRIVNNRIIDLFRKRKLHTVSLYADHDNTEEGPLSLAAILPDLSGTPFQEEWKEMIWETIEDTLSSLPASQREVFVMHEFEDISFREIAEKTGIGINTLISRKRYAVLALRNNLKYLYNQLNDE